MIKVKVKTIWEGKVAVRDKYIDEARATGQGLIITHKQGFMVIPNEEINSRIDSYSEQFFADHFSDKKHQLVYFLWKPTRAQLELIGGD